MKMHLDLHEYNEYSKLCQAFEVEPLTFEEIYENVDGHKVVEHAKEIESRAEELGIPGKALIGGFNKLWKDPAVQRGFQDAGRAAFQQGKNILRTMAWGTGYNGVIDFVADKVEEHYSGGGNNGGGNQGGNNSGNGKGSSMGKSPNSNLNNLQFKDNPMELKLDTGILSRVWTESIATGTSEFAPMHMTSIDMSLQRLLSNGEVSNYFSKAFYTKLLNFAQSKVNFSVASLDAFSEINLRKYFDAIIDGLNCYYFFVSIMGYFENPQNNNYAMIDLRNKISPDMMNQLVILRRLLTTSPVPPKLMNLLFYLNGNFKANHLDGSALIKFETARLEVAYIEGITDTLKSVEKTSSLMGRIFPEWMYEDLPSYPGVGFHDWNFNTIWTNAPYSVLANGAQQQGPFVIFQDDGSITYQTFSSELDGVSMALTSIHNGTEFIPGFIQPYRTGVINEATNRVSWDHRGWVNSAIDSNLAAARMDTYPACEISTQTLLDPEIKGICEPVRSVNLSTIRQAHFDFIDFMASFDVASRSEKKESTSYKSKRNRRK